VDLIGLRFFAGFCSNGFPKKKLQRANFFEEYNVQFLCDPYCCFTQGSPERKIARPASDFVIHLVERLANLFATCACFLSYGDHGDRSNA
jgi:hypothetical protein